MYRTIGKEETVTSVLIVPRTKEDFIALMEKERPELLYCHGWIWLPGGRFASILYSQDHDEFRHYIKIIPLNHVCTGFGELYQYLNKNKLLTQITY